MAGSSCSSVEDSAKSLGMGTSGRYFTHSWKLTGIGAKRRVLKRADDAYPMLLRAVNKDVNLDVVLWSRSPPAGIRIALYFRLRNRLGICGCRQVSVWARACT
jgi:hypothetical protein